MLITDTTQRLGINTMTHLFLQTFFCGDWYGKSITDPCLGWEDTERLIYDIAEMCK